MSDIKVPLIDKDSPHRTFNENDIYGWSDNGRFVPNMGDHVLMKGVDQRRVFTSVDYSTYVFEHRIWGTADADGESGGVVKGAVNYYNSKFSRIYVDETKSPPTMRFDPRFGFNIPGAESIRVFLTNDVSDDKNIISGYQQGGELVSTDIPLTNSDSDNLVKVPLTGVLTKPIEGDHVEVFYVVYDGAGVVSVLESAQLIKTAYISKAEAPQRVVKDVRLKSPWLTTPTSNTLRLPINLPYDDMLLSVEVIYNDGKIEIPIDGVRANLIGLRNAGTHDTFYLSTNAGQELDLLFSYRLGQNEIYVGPDLEGGSIVKDYYAVTEVVDGAYSLKLFVVPEWVSQSSGYRLRYYLYDLRRGNVYEATAHVRPASGQDIFDPTLYGVKQKLNVTVDANAVNASYKTHQHAQSFNITLVNEGTHRDTNFILEYVHGEEAFGVDTTAIYNYNNVSQSTLDITCGCNSLTEWLAKLYYSVYPLYDRIAESGPLTPTHFQVRIGNNTFDSPVANWHQVIDVPSEITAGETVELRWMRRETNDDLELGISGMLVHRDIS